MRQRGLFKWRKLHIGVDEATGEIVTATLSTNDFGDSDLLPELFDQIEDPLEQVSAHDSHRCNEAVGEHKARATISP